MVMGVTGEAARELWASQAAGWHGLRTFSNIAWFETQAFMGAAVLNRSRDRRGERRAMSAWKRQLLLIEGDPVVRDSLKNALEREGLGVSAVSGGREALFRFAAGCFDTVLLDLAGSREGGWELLRSLKEVNPKAKIIVLTVKRDLKDAALSMGACGAFEKPVAIPALLQAVADSMSELDESLALSGVNVNELA
jgi:CheY-like chemotaxis protein